jgi:hypothetical protein
MNPMATLSNDVLEERAALQRRQLAESVHELKSTVQDKMDVRKQAREHLLPAAGILALVGLAVGFGIGGALPRMNRNPKQPENGRSYSDDSAFWGATL